MNDGGDCNKDDCEKRAGSQVSTSCWHHLALPRRSASCCLHELSFSEIVLETHVLLYTDTV